ncbi:MAG: lipopolysaccharide transport periplasmic protein LptA [Burkholderiaceae bacterium]|nr:MAG: lipopolysaccharide transport periplasmic protein LptA [Burkholderiaceae bacterium]
MNRAALLLRSALRASAVVALLAWAALPAWADLADKEQPMHIESDALRYESQQQLSIFTGNVVVTKGTIIMRGARLEVRQDSAGNQSATIFGAPGKRAFFHQKREGLNEFVEGEGNRIDYDGKTDIVKFIGDAEARRLVGTKVQDDIKGAVITYNNVTEVYTVDSGAAAAGAANPGGRVRALLMPQDTGPNAKKGTPAPVPLKPSTQLPGAKH